MKFKSWATALKPRNRQYSIKSGRKTDAISRILKTNRALRLKWIFKLVYVYPLRTLILKIAELICCHQRHILKGNDPMRAEAVFSTKLCSRHSSCWGQQSLSTQATNVLIIVSVFLTNNTNLLLSFWLGKYFKKILMSFLSD